MKAKMFCKGDKYNSIEDFLVDYRNPRSSRYTYYNQKLMHINFVGGMRLNSIVSAIDKGILYKVIANE